MRRFVLDSDVVIWVLRARPKVVAHVEELAGNGSLIVSAITRAEVLSGVRPGEGARTMRLLDSLSTASVSGAIADKAGELHRELAQRGVTIHLPDAIIAATALDAGAELHTCNARHYAMMSDVALVAVAT